MQTPEPRNVDAVLSSVGELWSPRMIAVVNDYDVLEPSATINTGDTPSPLTADRHVI